MEMLGTPWLATNLCSGRRWRGNSATMTKNVASASAPGVPEAEIDAATLRIRLVYIDIGTRRRTPVSQNFQNLTLRRLL